jgi:hypothetical protein
MQAEQERLVEVVDAILRYLHSHPDAVDTVEGIAKWWLPPEKCSDARIVEEALARLEAQGLVHRRTNADRHILYSR